MHLKFFLQHDPPSTLDETSLQSEIMDEGGKDEATSGPPCKKHT